ncbi:hypothetical protein [Bradyrhizobium sp. OAE829]|uniref:hypothetical protein n=1 Tax=Bradyrhizobium sp. OAE829 TaxID=2663807 RepID=UPI00178A5DE8
MMLALVDEDGYGSHPMFDWIKKNLFGRQPQVDPYDQCVIEFIEECRRQGCVLSSYDHQDRSFRFGTDAGLKVQLDNLFASWLPLDQHGRAEAVAKFVRSIVESGENTEISPETLSEQLMPGIRARTLIGGAMLQNWIAGAPADGTTEIAWLPFAGDLAACVVWDKPLTMAPMTRLNLKFADIPIDRAMSRAMTNFRARMPAVVFEPVGKGVFGCNMLDDHQSALLLLQLGKDYVVPPLEGTPVALVPSRNTFYVTGSANTAGLTTLLDRSETASQLPHFCSSMILQWAGDRWSEFHFDSGTANADRQRRIALDRLTNDYRVQKQLLDQFYQKQSLDIPVSEVLVFHKPNQETSLVTVTALGSAARGTLLPQVERLNFVKQTIDPRTGQAQADDVADVAWSEAMDVVGSLLEPVPYLYPPRFRALGFPDAVAWAKLKALTRQK